NSGRLPFRRERWWCADDDDGVGSEPRKLCRKLVVGLGLTEHESVFDREVLTFNVAQVAQPAEHRLLKVRVGGWREIAETRVLRRLRARHHRPCRHARNRSDEVASFQEPLPAPRGSRPSAIDSGIKTESAPSETDGRCGNVRRVNPIWPI